MIEVWSANAPLKGRLQQLWHMVFPLHAETQFWTRPVVRFRLFDQGHLPPPDDAQPLRQQAHLHIWRTAIGFYLSCGEAALLLDLAHSTATGFVPASFWARPLNQQREFFTFALFFLLRAHGFYALHANAVKYQGQGLLLAGPSGSGKTTLTLQLRAAGWQSVGDDALLATETAEGVVVHPLRRGFSCTPETLAHLPDLTLAPDAPLLDRQKRLLVPVDKDGTTGGQPCLPQVLLLPTIVPQAASYLTPLVSGQALFALLKQTVGLLLDNSLAPDHLQTLTRLVTQARCYQLAFGRDGLEQPAAVVRLLETVLVPSHTALRDLSVGR